MNGVISSRQQIVALALGFAAGLIFGASLAHAQPAAESGSAGASADAVTEGGLETAYKKEFAFLNAQRRQLTQRIAEMEAAAKKETSEAKSQIGRLEDEVLVLGARSDRLQEQIDEAHRAIEANTGNSETLEAVFDQATATLRRHGAVVDSDALAELGDEAKVGRLFEMTGNLVHDLSSVRQSPGAYYLRDGAKVTGTLFRVGSVAAYGVSDGGSGVLAPAGGGQYKLWDPPAADIAQALVRGDRPDSLALFLYESLDKQAAEDREKTVLGVIESGGIIGWAIMALGGLALLLILLRAAFLNAASTNTGEVLQRVGDLVTKGELKNALEECTRTKGSTGRVVAAAIRNLDRDREHLEDIISESILNESAHLNRFGAFILVLAAVAPLLGLLGTVTGMIETFDVITVFGTGDPKLLSGGISTALVTTELGLGVAIPALILGHLLSGWSERIKDDMEKAALRITNLYHQAQAAL